MLIIRRTKQVIAAVLVVALGLAYPAATFAKEDLVVAGIVNPLETKTNRGTIGAAVTTLAPDISTTLTEEEANNPPKFADTIDLPTLAKEAKHVPITSLEDLIEEMTVGKNLTTTQARARVARFSTIGTIGVVNVSNSLNVREEPSATANIVGKLYQNTGAVVGNYAGTNGDWMYVYSGSVCGWVLSKYIMTGNMATSLYNVLEPQVATVVADETTVYEEPDDESDDMTDLEEGKQLPVLAIVGDYVKIQVTSYAEGYVKADHVSVDKGLGVGVKADEDELIQIDIEVRKETRRILAEQEAAEAAEAERIAKEKAAAAASSRSSSSSSSSGSRSGNYSSDGSGWTYLGKFRVTYYCQGSCGGNRWTASGVEAQEHYTCATSSQLSFGSVVKVDGCGTWVVQDRGVGNNQIDLFVYDSEASGLFYRDVWLQN